MHEELRELHVNGIWGEAITLRSCGGWHSGTERLRNMLNLYKTMSRQQQAAGGDDRHTGHDRFATVSHGDQRTRRRRRPPTRRAQSALELNPQALVIARASLQRSASTETDPNDSSEERTPLLGRLFSCVNVSSTVTADNNRSARPWGNLIIIFFYLVKNNNFI